MRLSVDHSQGTWTQRTQMSGPRQTPPLVVVFAWACRVLAHTRVFRFLNYFKTLKTRRLLYKKKDYGLYRIRHFWDTEPFLTHCWHEVTRAVDRAAFQVKANSCAVSLTRWGPLSLPASLFYVPGPAGTWVHGLRCVSGVVEASNQFSPGVECKVVLVIMWDWSEKMNSLPKHVLFSIVFQTGAENGPADIHKA